MQKILLFSLVLSVFFICECKLNAQVYVRVNANKTLGKLPQNWAFFGHDEPNYTYMPDGKKLLTELVDLSEGPIRVRTHNLLTTDVGVAPNLKWGFTNAYTEDLNGNAIYNWIIIDSIFDIYKELGIKPLVEMGFMPKAMSTHPEPYAHDWVNQGELWTGWTYPPKDYKKWELLIYNWVKHSVERYGEHEVESWLWQVWNEPNIGYWSGTFDEYCKLYDYAAKGLKDACPKCVIGGPHTTNPNGEKAINYLTGFIEHCLKGKNYATGKTGSPLEFIAFHAKGNPTIVNEHIQMDMAVQLKSIENGFKVIKSFPEMENIPIIIGENDPEGCAACSSKRDPKFGYRNGLVYPSYTVASFDKIWQLQDKYKVNLAGILSWAFEFEGQEWFAGFRDLATNGVDKPILNVFRMFGMLGDNRIEASSTGAIDLDSVIVKGIKEDSEIGVLATKKGSQTFILLWNYHDDDVARASKEVIVDVNGILGTRSLIKQYAINQEFSNAFEKWKQLGSPQDPSLDQIRQLENAGMLEMSESPKWITHEPGMMKINLFLPHQGLQLFVIE